MSGNKKIKKGNLGKKPLTHGWVVVPSKTYPDRVYFYNKITNCSTWNNPCEELSSSDLSSSESLSPKKNRSNKHKNKSQSTSYKSSKKKNVNEVKNKESDEIDDYDEDCEYFNESVNFNHSRVSPESDPDSFVVKKQNSEPQLSNISSNLGEEKKELWLHFISSPDNPGIKKSVVMSDLNTPSTSRKNSEGEKVAEKSKVSPRSRFSVYEQSSKVDPEKESSGKRKKKKKRTHSFSADRKKNDEKSINNVSFKRRDKTPAQTRLLKLRQQNAEMLKKFAVNQFQNFDQSTSHTPSTSRQSSIDVCAKRSEVFKNDSSQSLDNFEEEMDWEPLSEELDVQNINEFRQKRDKANNISNDILFGLAADNIPTLPSETNTWLLVLDTNIFVSCLNFVKEARDTNFPDLGYPILYVPWRVLQELDHLKDTKFESSDRPLSYGVRRSIAYLNDNFKSRHPRCIGQSFEEFAKMVDVENSAPDDEILQTCIHLQKLYPEKKLTLLTNDKNLESKAIISNVEAYSKEGFLKKYFSSNPKSSKKGVFRRPCMDVNQLDNVVCGVKNLLKGFIPKVVETEMKKAFQGDWIKLAYKKPPWTLQDAMECFTRHWRSVFFLVFSKDTFLEFEKLYQSLFKKEPASVQDACELIQTTLRLISLFEKSQKRDTSYSNVLECTKLKLMDLLVEITSSKSSQADSSTNSATSFSQENSTCQESVSYSTAERFGRDSSYGENNVQLAKNLFREIWDALKGFCCVVSDILNSSSTNNNVCIPEIRPKLVQILNEIRELLLIADELIEINLKEICEDHPLVVRLSNFLVKICPAMASEIKERLPLCLTALFTDTEGRSLLTKSLVDFREFSQDLIKANDYFEKTYPSF